MEVYIEKVHGLQSTSISLNDRFTVLLSTGPARVYRPRRRPMGFMNRGLNQRNRNLVEQIARRIEYQTKLRLLRQSLGLNQRGNNRFRRYGSEHNLSRSNSFGNLSKRSFGRNWGGSYGNLSRAASNGNLSQLERQVWRGRRNGANWVSYGTYKNYQGRVNRAFHSLKSMRGRGGVRGRGRRGIHSGLQRYQNPKPVPSKEELDLQLDEYMASSKSVLDKELDEYMNFPVEMEE